jgi:FOG: Ankyrin repeat
MNIGYFLRVSFGFKVGLFIFCYSLLLINKAFGVNYFSTMLNENQQLEAVRNASDVNARNGSQMTGLMFAANEGMLPLAKGLFEKGADLNMINPINKYTALHYAVSNPLIKNQEVAWYLMDVYANANIKNNVGNTPMHGAINISILESRLKMIQKLVKNGGNINAQNNEGDTLLHMIVQFRDTYAVTAILKAWGSIIDLNLKNKKGYTPHGLAEFLNFFDLAALFNTVTKIVSPTIYDTHGLNGLMLAVIGNDMTCLKKMVSDLASVRSVSRDEYGNTPLHIALAYENLPAIQLLIDKGADLGAKNKFGDTPLHYVIRLSNQDARMNIAKKIIGSNLSYIDTPNNNGNTLLHYLVQYNDSKLMSFILTTYAGKINIKAQNKKFQTPYAMAIQFKREEISKLLLKAQNK